MVNPEFIDDNGILRIGLPFEGNTINISSCNFFEGEAIEVQDDDLFCVVATKGNKFDDHACEVQLSLNNMHVQLKCESISNNVS